MGRDSATFWDKGPEAPSLFRDKGTTGQAKNLAKGLGRDGLGQDGPGQSKSWAGHGTKRDRAEKDVPKQENDVLKRENNVQKQEIWLFF